METEIAKRVSDGKGIETMELREMILEGTIKAFNRKGLKFTMDDIARELAISKKTIYMVFADKESLFLAMVDYMFDHIIVCVQQLSDGQIAGNFHNRRVDRVLMVTVIFV